MSRDCKIKGIVLYSTCGFGRGGDGSRPPGLGVEEDLARLGGTPLINYNLYKSEVFILYPGHSPSGSLDVVPPRSSKAYNRGGTLLSSNNGIEGCQHKVKPGGGGGFKL